MIDKDKLAKYIALHLSYLTQDKIDEVVVTNEGFVLDGNVIESIPNLLDLVKADEPKPVVSETKAEVVEEEPKPVVAPKKKTTRKKK